MVKRSRQDFWLAMTVFKITSLTANWYKPISIIYSLDELDKYVKCQEKFETKGSSVVLFTQDQQKSPILKF